MAYGMIEDITCYELGKCCDNGSGNKDRDLLFDLQEREYPEDYKESDPVYGKPGPEHKSTVDKSSAVIDHIAPYGFIYPAKKAVYQEILHIISKNGIFFVFADIPIHIL